MSTCILGISAYYHDSAAALIKDGMIVAAAQEERFTRIKHDRRFPRESSAYCLKTAGITLRDVDYVVYYEKPLIKFERLLETYLNYAPRGWKSFITAMPEWLKEKLFMKELLTAELVEMGRCAEGDVPPLLFSAHHQAHAASAFYPSPFERAAVLCMDGVGEWATTSVWEGEGNLLTPRWQMDFPHSLGLLYSAFTAFTGFKVNDGEYKLMGLAPFGEPRFTQVILNELIDLKDDGTFRLNMRYFDFAVGRSMTNTRFAALFGGPPHVPEDPLTQREMDIARSIQVVIEDIVLRLARSVHRESGTDALCLAGGVALNCVANGRILREGPYRNIWIQPAAGDAGGAVGAALAAWHEHLRMPRKAESSDAMHGTFLGPALTTRQIQAALDAQHAVYQKMEEDELLACVADLLDQGKIVGWFQGRMEFGPRALGNRSILGDPRRPAMRSHINQKIKFRESFRPFAPSVLEEDAADYFALDTRSPYMLLVARVQEGLHVPLTSEQERLAGFDKLDVARSSIPSVTHVDGTARVHTVGQDAHSRFYRLLKAFKKRTGCSVLINTSFNVRGEPIVCTPEDAYRCFMCTGLDYLVVEDLLLDKRKQPAAALNGNAETDPGKNRELGPEQSTSELRRFAFTAGGLLAVVFGFILPWSSRHAVPVWPWISALSLTVTGILLPRALRPFYRGWMRFALLLGRVNSAVLLAAVFIVIMIPAGTMMRIFGYDPLQMRRAPDLKSYRKPSHIPPVRHMERTY